MADSNSSPHELASIGRRFHRYFRSKGLTGVEVGTLLDKSPTLISKMVNGTRFSSEVLGAIIVVFPDLNIDWLLYERGEMETPAEQLSSDYLDQISILKLEYERLKNLGPATTNRQAKERTLAIRSALNRAIDIRVRLMSEQLDMFQLINLS